MNEYSADTPRQPESQLALFDGGAIKNQKYDGGAREEYRWYVEDE